jgi:hypothetical protein
LTQLFQDKLCAAYIESKRDRLKHILYRLNHRELASKLEYHPHGTMIKEIILYFYCYKWLRRFVHPRYYDKVIFQSRHKTYDFLVDILIHSSDEEQFLKNYILHCSKPEYVTQAPHNFKAKLFYEYHNNNLNSCVSEILSVWSRLGYLMDTEAHQIAEEARTQHRIYDDIYSDNDKERLSIIDRLQCHHNSDDSLCFEKLALIPTFKCSTGCRHCLFIWRPGLKKLYEKTKLFDLVNNHAKNVLFTGGDLTQYCEDFFNAIKMMSAVENFAILLNGRFADTKEKAEQFMESINAALKERKRKGWKNAFITVQISFDEFHQEVLIDRKGKFYERVSVSNIVNIMESSSAFDSISVVLLHKQNPYNFSDALINKGVFARLAHECSQRKRRIKIITCAASPIQKIHPVSGKKTCSMITDIHFLLSNGHEKVFTLNSSLVESLGRARFLESTEYVSAENIRDYSASGRIEGEKFDSDLMLWYNGWVTTFAAPHLILGNLFDDNFGTILTRWYKDPLLGYLKNFNPKLIYFYKEIASDYEQVYAESSSHVNLFTNIIRSSAVRLYLTKRILIDLRDKGKIDV